MDNVASNVRKVETASVGGMSPFTLVTHQPNCAIIWDESETFTEHPWSRDGQHKATISTSASGVKTVVSNMMVPRRDIQGKGFTGP
jgi:hypothetical protein